MRYVIVFVAGVVAGWVSLIVWAEREVQDQRQLHIHDVDKDWMPGTPASML